MRLSCFALATVACCLRLESSAAFAPNTSRLSKISKVTLINIRIQERSSLMKMSETPQNDSSGRAQFDFSDALRPIVFGEELTIPFITGKSIEFENMKNDGIYSWMYPYMNLLGFKSGNTLVGAVAQEATAEFSAVEMEALRQKAAEEMANISDDERARRGEMSNVCYAASAVYAAVSGILLDDGLFTGHLIRFAIFLPLVTARGLQISANRGLWNLAQAGLWDVAGTIEPVEDPNLARAFLEKVNSVNNESTIYPLIAASIWSVLPQVTTSLLAWEGLILTFLYLVRDKIPRKV